MDLCQSEQKVRCGQCCNQYFCAVYPDVCCCPAPLISIAAGNKTAGKQAFWNPPRGSRLHKAANITLLRLCHTWTENARRPARGAALFFWGVCTCRAGPMCPAAGSAFFGGARGPRPTGRYVEPRVGDGVSTIFVRDGEGGETLICR